jgi:hypothetical protein
LPLENFHLLCALVLLHAVDVCRRSVVRSSGSVFDFVCDFDVAKTHGRVKSRRAVGSAGVRVCTREKEQLDCGKTAALCGGGQRAWTAKSMHGSSAVNFGFGAKQGADCAV